MEAQAVPIRATVWLVDRGVFVSLDDDEIAERLSETERAHLNILREFVRDFKWTIEVEINDQWYRITWGSPEAPDNAEQSPR